jgi:hypothetical protein
MKLHEIFNIAIPQQPVLAEAGTPYPAPRQSSLFACGMAKEVEDFWLKRVKEGTGGRKAENARFQPWRGL